MVEFATTELATAELDHAEVGAMEAVFAKVVIGLPAGSDFDVDAFARWVRHSRLRPIFLENGHLVTLSGSVLF